MKLRSLHRLWPSDFTECILMSAAIGLIPTAYYIIITKVVPELLDYGSAGYIFLQLLAGFLFFNVMSNFMMCLLVDPSIDPTTMRWQVERIKKPRGWHKCEQCEIWAPTRSRHCKTCDVCVLKRDHHCLVFGGCVGHANYRYFFYFIIYLLISAIIAFIINFAFILVMFGGSHKLVLFPFSNGLPDVNYVNERGELNLMDIFKCLIPSSFAIVFSGLFISNAILLYSTISALYKFWAIFTSGITSYELKTKNFTYDRGYRLNLQMILGTRMKWTWISPFVSSPLPHDGIHWLSEEEEVSELTNFI